MSDETGQHIKASDYPDPGSALIAYRLSIVETEISGLDKKLDKFIEVYPSKEILALILRPYDERIADLELKNVESEKQKIQAQQQYKTVTYGAIISPLASLILAALVAVVVAGLKL